MDDHFVHYIELWKSAPIDRIAWIKAGLPASSLPYLAHEMHATNEQVFHWVGISRPMANRKIRARKILSASESESTLGLARLIGLVAKVIYESGEPKGFNPACWTGQWLTQPNPALGGFPPGQYMNTAEGRAIVYDLISRSTSGNVA